MLHSLSVLRLLVKIVPDLALTTLPVPSSKASALPKHLLPCELVWCASFTTLSNLINQKSVVQFGDHFGRHGTCSLTQYPVQHSGSRSLSQLVLKHGQSNESTSRKGSSKTPMNPLFILDFLGTHLEDRQWD